VSICDVDEKSTDSANQSFLDCVVSSNQNLGLLISFCLTSSGENVKKTAAQPSAVERFIQEQAVEVSIHSA
jgi:hypothetical protein